jgi:hypothetical protein
LGYLDSSSGPQLVPPIPDPEAWPYGFREIGLLWGDDVALRGPTRRRARLPRGLFYYLTDLERYNKFKDDDQFESEPDFDPPADETELDIHRRSLYWTLVFFIVGHELLNQAVTPPGYPIDVSVGYFDPKSESDAFGLAFAIDPADLSYEAIPREPVPLYLLPIVRDGQVRLPRIYGWPDPGGPLVVRRPRQNMELHGPPGFGGASAASYVRHAATGTPMGLLGCQHVLPTPTVGAAVPVAGFPNQTVTAISDPSLDLAVVSSPTPIPTTPRPVQRWPAQWQPCAIDGNVSSVTTRIADITNTWGVFSDPKVPVSVDLDDAGTHGDSGAAVVDSCAGSAGGICGVYRGAINNQGPTKGRAAHIQQVEKVMDVELVI